MQRTLKNKFFPLTHVLIVFCSISATAAAQGIGGLMSTEEFCAVVRVNHLENQECRLYERRKRGYEAIGRWRDAGHLDTEVIRHQQWYATLTKSQQRVAHMAEFVPGTTCGGPAGTLARDDQYRAIRCDETRRVWLVDPDAAEE